MLGKSVALKASSNKRIDKQGSTIDFIIDSGASFHVHPVKSDLVNTRPCSNRISGVDNVEHECPLIGDLQLEAKGSDGLIYQLLIRNVRYAPTVSDSLLSVSQLWSDSKVNVAFGDKCTLISSCGQQLPFTRSKRNALYIWHVRRASSPPLQKKPKPEMPAPAVSYTHLTLPTTPYV